MIILNRSLVNTNDVITSASDLIKLETHISSKIPLDIFFRIPKIIVNQGEGRN